MEYYKTDPLEFGKEKGIILSKKTPLVVLTKEDVFSESGYLIGKKRRITEKTSPYSPALWEPYRIGDKIDFSRSSGISSMGKYQDEDASDLKDGKEYPFVLVEGDFPRGCGVTTWQPRVIIAPKAKTEEGFLKDLYDFMGYDSGAKIIARGKLISDRDPELVYTVRQPAAFDKTQVQKMQPRVRVYDFSKDFFEVRIPGMGYLEQSDSAIGAYESVLEALVTSDCVAEKGTPIFFKATAGKLGGTK